MAKNCCEKGACKKDFCKCSSKGDCAAPKETKCPVLKIGRKFCPAIKK